MKLRTAAVLCLILLGPPSCVGSCVIHDDMLDSRFDRVENGLKREDLVRALGSPRSIEACDSKASSFAKSDSLPGCADSYEYPSWGVPLIPRVWVVWLGDDHKVIGKAIFTSP